MSSKFCTHGDDERRTVLGRKAPRDWAFSRKFKSYFGKQFEVSGQTGRVGKSKVELKIGHEGRKGEWRYISTLSLTLALDGGGWSPPRPDRFNPGERDSVPTIQEAEWASLSSCGKSRLDRDSIPGSSRPQRAAILPTLSRLLWKRCWNLRFRNKKKTKLSLSMPWRHTGGA